jgi:hypothetical protein
MLNGEFLACFDIIFSGQLITNTKVGACALFSLTNLILKQVIIA